MDVLLLNVAGGEAAAKLQGVHGTETVFAPGVSGLQLQLSGHYCMGTA